MAENERFRRHLKRHNFPELRFRRIAEEIEDQIDCRACANCCKVAETDLNERDVERLARYLRITPRQFIAEYTTASAFEEEGNHPAPPRHRLYLSRWQRLHDL